jgi:hypothetical protein
VRKRSFGRSRFRWKDTIKVDRQEIGCDREHELNLSCSGWTKLASPCEQGNERLGYIKWGEFQLLSNCQLLKKEMLLGNVLK